MDLVHAFPLGDDINQQCFLHALVWQVKSAMGVEHSCNLYSEIDSSFLCLSSRMCVAVTLAIAIAVLVITVEQDSVILAYSERQQIAMIES